MSFADQRLANTLTELRSAGTFKVLRNITAPMGPVTTIDGVGEVLVFCSNNYLGLANHPEVVEAGIEGLRKYGAGTASVRFICGSFDCHRVLEEKVAEFFGTEAALTWVSCWNANEGLLPTVLEEGDALISDGLNHASIIDAGRLSRKATRKVFEHSNLQSLEQQLETVSSAPLKLVVTDGVFSMEGDTARLDEIVAVCDRHGATLVVDDSHGTGVLGQHGRGAHEHFGLPCGTPQGVEILTSTFGKALGGANGGFVAGSRDLIDYLIQRSRPHLFSNALAPTTACVAIKAIEILQREPERVAQLHSRVDRMRSGLRSLDYEVMDSPSGIIPIMIGDTAAAMRLSAKLLEQGVFVVGFGFPVVPEGEARLRIQMSAAHTDEQIDRALDAFARLRSHQ